MKKKKMKQILFLSFITLFMWQAGTFRVFSQDKLPVFAAETLQGRLERIIKESGISISYTAETVKDIQAQALEPHNALPEEWLRESLKNTGLTYSTVGDRMFAVVRQAKQEPGSAAAQQPRGKGSLAGTVLDEKGLPVIGATVFIFKPAGESLGTVTDIDGKYTLEGIPAGTASVQISLMSYETLQVMDVKIAAGKTTPLNVVLKESTQQLGEVVVTANYRQASAAGLYAVQKLSVSMTDGISSDLIKKTSDNNIAQVLKRVAGVTIQDNKYVTVRGMSERYNNVQLNGASMPSTEPNRRNFSFDVVPSALVSNITVAKTFTPDLPGEFTGGLVEIETLSIPESSFLNLSLGTGFNTNSTGKEFLSAKRFAADYLFGALDERKWYTGLSQEDLAVNAANAASWNRYPLYKYTAQPLQSYSMAGGLPFRIGEHHRLSLVLALTYRNEQNKENIKETRTLIRDSLLQEAQRYVMTTTTGAITNIGWETKGHNITWRNLFNNRFSHSNQKRYMQKTYEGFPFMDIYSIVLNSRIMQTQLEGKHKLFNNNLLFNWNASLNDVLRTNPGDTYASAMIGDIAATETYYDGGRTEWSYSTGSSAVAINKGHLMYSNLHELKKNLSADMEIPFILLDNPQRIKTGYWGAFRTASYRQQYLKPEKGRGSLLDGADIYDFFDPVNFHGNSPALSYARGGSLGGAEYYDGRLNINAGYLMAEFSAFHKLHLTGGFRMEKGNNRVITTWGRYEADVNKYVVKEDTATLDKTDWLPALSLVYNITGKLNARLAYSKTVIRPDFRELSYCAYYNVNDRLWVYNLKPLEQTGVENYDLRLEYYPGAGEVISLSTFYKKFANPVEMIAQMQASAQEYYLYSMNLKEAEMRGLELNLRKSFNFIAPGTFLENLYVNGNFSLLEGNITYNYDAMMNPVEDGSGGRERPLQGLSPYVVNAGLSYQDSRIGMAVNYTRNGRKLLIGGDHAKYDQYENPRNVLDLQISALFLKQRLEVKLNASDILNEDIIVYRNMSYSDIGGVLPENGDIAWDNTGLGMDYNPGDHVMSRIGKGINFSASVSYKF